ncbi:hypothetical protein M7I_6468 [Glarea lozoyensis 74030]|uniref:Uncharacterized protein n=1 Tax=Glarea lozoyensis (strain ATCC 74030 / MF5533) TaxID=1104152 RepID=H0EUN1_GLAL7|nr:hypothetical protein M7I_6468 [Glarea lozoyensis 74030]
MEFLEKKAENKPISYPVPNDSDRRQELEFGILSA